MTENEGLILDSLSEPIQPPQPIQPTKPIESIQQIQQQISNSSNHHQQQQIQQSQLQQQSTHIIEVYFQQFTLHTHPGQMDLTRFIKLCYDCIFITKKFTVVDAELSFLRAKKKALISKNEKYKSGVFYDKRINFIVFYDILLRCIVEKMNEPIEYILHKLINAAKR